MLTLDEASRRILARAHPTDAEEVLLADALDRVLADPRVVAPADVPPFANSAMDGFALRAADTPGELQLKGEVRAGAATLPAVQPGTAVRIMTGAPLPPGADVVVPIEEAVEADGAVRIADQATRGRHVRAAGHDTAAGDEVCLPGMLTPAGIGVLASLGIDRVAVRRRPVVAVVSTGDELVPPGVPLGPGQIHDANTAAVAASVADAGGVAHVVDHLPDEAGSIERALTDAAHRADLIVTTGGVSVGRHDLVRAVLEQRGSLDLWRVAVQPGKPLAVGALAGTTVIGLPGNPVSALVTFELFVRPFVRAMLGLSGDGRLRVRATPETRIGKDPKRRAFLRVSVWHEDGVIRARPSGGQASSQLRAMADANALLVVPEGQEAAEPHLSYEAIVFEPLLLDSWR
jgi:molybdopterin molybdotransferase